MLLLTLIDVRSEYYSDTEMKMAVMGILISEVVMIEHILAIGVVGWTAMMGWQSGARIVSWFSGAS